MPFGNRDRRDLVIERRMEPLVAEAAKGPSDHGFEGLHPGAAYGSGGASDGHLFLIIHRDDNGTSNMHRCQDSQEAQRFLESLLSQGINPEAINLFQASKVAFKVSFRPVVNLVASIGGKAARNTPTGP